jgi:hypothetical protein
MGKKKERRSPCVSHRSRHRAIPRRLSVPGRPRVWIARACWAPRPPMISTIAPGHSGLGSQVGRPKRACRSLRPRPALVVWFVVLLIAIR